MPPDARKGKFGAKLTRLTRFREKTVNLPRAPAKDMEQKGKGGFMAPFYPRALL
jgi:hypothetical protein